MVTGLDLVEQMIRVAAGEKLAFRQEDVKLDGWAIEARVYAEDPLRGFLPSTGRLVKYREPVAGASVRVDSGVFEGAEIAMFYDPMIAKLVTHGADRRQAIAAMCEALDAFVIRGVGHNIPFLASLMAHPRFAAGKLTTNFIAEEYPDGFGGVTPAADHVGLLVAVAAVVHHRYRERDQQISGRVHPPKPSAGADWVVMIDRVAYPATVAETASGCAVIAGKASFELISDWRLGDPLYHGTVNGRPVSVQIDRKGVGYRLSHGGAQLDLQVLTPRAAELAALMPVKQAPDMSRFLLSPMPGLLVSVAAEIGQEIKAGQELAVVEAMKMENVLRAERDGKVQILHAKPGDSLAVDQAILEFE
jgi:propionyl-CoA carboxylase alpha chain